MTRPSHTQVLAAASEAEAFLRIIGIATFDCGSEVRNFYSGLLDKNVRQFTVYLSECDGMDSTFIGILTMTVQRARESSGVMRVLNASDRVFRQIAGLGIDGLFEFTTESIEQDLNWIALNAVDADYRTLLEAHDALGKADAENIDRFAGVVDLLKKKGRRASDTD